MDSRVIRNYIIKNSKIIKNILQIEKGLLSISYNFKKFNHI